jgi:hypothetical protein
LPEAGDRGNQYIVHGHPQQLLRQSAVPIALANPFVGHLEQVSAGPMRVFREIPHLAGDEIQGKRPQFGELAEIVVMKARFRQVAYFVSKFGIVRGKNPLCEMAELGFQSTALVVDITSGYKALIENFAPRMPFHSKFNVGLNTYRLRRSKADCV